MQHKPEVEFTCDCIGCTASMFLEMTFYVGGYELRDQEIKERLPADHGWLVIDGQHFCSRECAEKAGYQA